MSKIIYVKLKYDIINDKFEVKTNAKDPKEILNNFIIGQMGKGSDDREPNKLDIYNIKIELDLTDDTFYVTHNCGNKGLREGILLRWINEGE